MNDASPHNTAAGPRRLLATVLTAALMLIAGGVTYRALDGLYAQPPASVPLPADTLTRLPKEIGLWRGRDMTMDEWVVKATDADLNLLRVYARSGDVRPVSFYAAYGIRGRDMLPHRPEVCYPGEGWTLQSDGLEILPLPDGRLPCRVFRFARSGLTVERLRVMNFFLVDGRFYSDLSDIRREIWRGSRRIGYIARVMLTCEDDDSDSTDIALSRLGDLAVLMAGPLRDLMPEAAQIESADIRHNEAIDEVP